MGQGGHGEGLGHARYALDEAVAAGEQADHGPLDHAVLADDHTLDLEEGVFEEVGSGAGVRRAEGFRRHSTTIGHDREDFL